MMSKVVRVNVSPAPYDVLVGDGILASLGQQLKSHFPAALKAAVIYDQTVRPHLEPAVTAAVAAAGLGLVTSQIDSGEENKHLATLLPVYTDLLSARIDRDTPVVGVGGGVLTDMAGFVAATILRGIALVQVPTTLLSMVDASVGGKTGINHAVGKNLIGAFHQPSLVLIDVQTLKTLPRDQISQGLAECIKHAAIRDAAHFADLEQNITRALDHDLPYLVDLVAHNVAIKARVVEHDPREKGIRAHLNFGHTFGHAIETVSNHAYPHGQAIAIGMTAASYLSVKLGLLSDADRTRLVNLLKKAELPTTCAGLAAGDLIQTMAFDKKAKSGHVRHVLLSGLGQACLRHDIPEALIREALAVIGSH
jgi:3-dehydroquinate synthase